MMDRFCTYCGQHITKSPEDGAWEDESGACGCGDGEHEPSSITLIHDKTATDASRNVQWDVDGWTVSYLYRYGSIWEVWIWETVNKNPHPDTPLPIGVCDASQAYEIVAKALGEPVPKP